MTASDPRAAGSPETPYVGLLAQIMTNTLDQDYQVAADRRRERPTTRNVSHRLIAAVVLLLFGLMVGISALRTQQQRPVAAAERDQLVAQIHARQQRLDSLHTKLSDLEGAVATLQQSAGTSRALEHQLEVSLSNLSAVAGSSAVQGPGLQIIADDAPGSAGSEQGVILDTDLQALVNALWTAGAEAISINEHRLTTLSAIRFAGRAITVNYRSLTPPYVIDAIGNPDTLPARLLETPGDQAWLALQRNFGIKYDVERQNDLVLPGDTATQLRQATAVPTR